MMKKTLPILLTVLLSGVLTTAWAAPDNVAPESVPPAHKQKNQVPDTTHNGDYLERQPNNNNPAKSSANQDTGNQTSRPSNMEKSKRFKKDPEQGGTDVNQR